MLVFMKFNSFKIILDNCKNNNTKTQQIQFFYLILKGNIRSQIAIIRNFKLLQMIKKIL